ncbi:MAG: esterase-like activity of phytase family protein, partial [Chitinophagaceae bacterium]|nr:esterase-like activity of phytase family protein [Rubrivivax sp.]
MPPAPASEPAALNQTIWRTHVIKLSPTLSLLAAAAALCCSGAASAQNSLSGWALMPANTFADGPTSGQFAGAGAGGNPLPLLNQQPVQGFSAVLNGPVAGTYLVMPDNGFGSQANSGDTLLRMYAVRPDWRTASGGSGNVLPVDFTTGAARPAFDAASRITLSDPNNRLSVKTQADYSNYYNTPANPLVDPSIRSGRLLTGADFDIEATRRDKNGNLWFGDEFGPYLVKTSPQGTVLRREIALPGVFAPQNEAVLNGNVVSNLNNSQGFEGMAINPAGDRLYTLLEGTVAGDPARTLRINEFNVDTERYTGAQWVYQLEPAGTAIGDMTAINDHEFLVIERNGSTATSPAGAPAPFKKIFRIDISQLDANGRVKKTEVVDLMNIADPNDLNGDGLATFTFPYVTIESVLILD